MKVWLITRFSIICTFSSLFSVMTLADISIMLILEKYKELARFLLELRCRKVVVLKYLVTLLF